MKLSVLIITYNQKKYIAQAIDSVLMQQADFDYEIVIGDDCSTDGTREIVSDYAMRYPGKINALLHPCNLGRFGVKNFAAAYKSCKGKYIAILEGDDYWTSPYKLQKQVEIMEKDGDIALTAHQMLITHENGAKESHLSNTKTPAVIPFERLISPGELMTGSLVLRKYLDQLPDWFFKYSFGDYPLALLQASYGKVCFNTEVMGVYRKHDDGLSNDLQWNSDYDLFEICDDLDKYTNYKRHSEIHDGVIRLYIATACWFKRRKDIYKMLVFMLKGIRHSRSIQEAIIIVVKCLIPEWVKSKIKIVMGMIKN